MGAEDAAAVRKNSETSTPSPAVPSPRSRPICSTVAAVRNTGSVDTGTMRIDTSSRRGASRPTARRVAARSTGAG